MPQNKQAFVNAIVQSLGAAAQPPPADCHARHPQSYYIGQPNELEILHGIDLTVWPGSLLLLWVNPAPAKVP